jgi:hypothetical protein
LEEAARLRAPTKLKLPDAIHLATATLNGCDCFLTNDDSFKSITTAEELDQDKLTPLLQLKYHGSIADAVADLGRPDEIGKVFAGFQKYLYQKAA